MSFTRRSFLIGAGSGLSALVLTACVPEATPSPTPTPTETSNAGVPSPAAFERSAWASDSFARGAMSYVAVRSSVDHRDALRQPIINRVFLCGEATSTDAAGTVRGAQRSGSFSAASLAAVADPTDKIAVVGAGAAGAEAARVLTLRGYDVTVIEARNRVGGRIHSFTSDNWPFPLELGAWRFSPSTDVDLLDTLERLDVETVARQAVPAETPPADVVFRSTTGEASADPVSATAVADALTWATRQWADVSLEQALTESGAAEAAAGATAGELAGAELLAQHLSWIATAYGADAAQLSSWFTPAVEDPTVFVTGELQTLVSDALDGVETFLSTTVVGVAYTDERVSLRLGTGESLAVDRVLITVPLGVLKDNGIEFEPLLPFSHRSAISALGMGTVNTVWLKFDEPFWTTDAVSWQLVGTDDDVTTWINLEPLTGDAVLVGIVGGEAALRMEEMSDDDLIAALRETLAPFAG